MPADSIARAVALHGLGKMTIHEGEFKKGLTLMEQSVAEFPLPLAYRNLAVYWNSEGDLEKGNAFTQKAIALDPKDEYNLVFAAVFMMAGCLLAAVSYLPIYHAMQRAAGSEVVTATSLTNKVTGAKTLTPQTLIDGKMQPAKQVLPYTNFASLISNPVAWKLILLVFIQVFFVTMVYGPIAAYLVEAFPARIRYTALSLPYHIGNGIFGGLLPVIGLSVVAQTGNIYAGLYYPIAVASITFIVGSLLLRETKHTLIWDEVK